MFNHDIALRFSSVGIMFESLIPYTTWVQIEILICFYPFFIPQKNMRTFEALNLGDGILCLDIGSSLSSVSNDFGFVEQVVLKGWLVFGSSPRDFAAIGAYCLWKFWKEYQRQ